MRIGPKYKIARRLKAPIFEKTQNQKFAVSEEKKSKGRRQGSKTDFGMQLTEKQKARFFYAVTEKQFKNYVKEALEKSRGKAVPSSMLFSLLESRLDNVVWRLGIARTHLGARQMTAHGHITINGKRVYTPSYRVNIDDVIGVREGSKKSPLFNKEEESPIAAPNWITYDKEKKTAVIKSKPSKQETEVMFDLGKVIEFYQR